MSLEVFKARAPEALKWSSARLKWAKEYEGAIAAFASLSGTELADYKRMELNMAKAFYAELNDAEQIAVGKVEAARPQSEFDRLVLEAYKWAQGLKQRHPEDRVRAQKAQLARSAADLQAEVRRWYKRRVR